MIFTNPHDWFQEFLYKLVIIFSVKWSISKIIVICYFNQSIHFLFIKQKNIYIN